MVTGPHVGPQRSYVPWLAVTAGGEHSLCSGGRSLARGLLRGHLRALGPNLGQAGEGALRGKQREMGGRVGGGARQ